MPRSCWAEGRAMFTMVASRTTISWASAMKTSAFQRLASPLGAAAPRALRADSDMEVPTSGLRDGKREEEREAGREEGPPSRTELSDAEPSDTELSSAELSSAEPS